MCAVISFVQVPINHGRRKDPRLTEVVVSADCLHTIQGHPRDLEHFMVGLWQHESATQHQYNKHATTVNHVADQITHSRVLTDDSAACWTSHHAGIMRGGRSLALECLGQTCLMPETCFEFLQ